MSSLETMWQDVRYGLRSLRTSPGFALLAVLTLGLGIGANTAIFSLIHGVLLEPLPYRDGEELVLIQQSAPGAGLDSIGVSIKEVLEYRQQLETFESVVEYHSMSFTLLSHGEPDRVLTGVVSANFFEVLGVRPLHGRTFVDEDDDLGADAVLVLSHPYWMRKFGGDPGIVGQVFEMNDRPHTVVGVLPPIPQYPRDNDVYMPTSACPFRARAETRIEEDRRAFPALTAFGRMRPQVGIERVASDVQRVASRWSRDHPQVYEPERSGFVAVSTPLLEELTREARPMLLILLGTSALVLLIACANVANLTLARTMERERELAVRSAMGAGRGRLLRQLLTESTLLALAGGALGVLLAWRGLDLLVSFMARFTPRVTDIDIDGTVLLFTLGVSVLTGIAFGVLPALGAGADLVGSLKEGGAQATVGRARNRLRGLLIVGQVAMAAMLLVGAGLLLSSFWRLYRVDAGFNAENVVTAEVFPNWSKYTTAQDFHRFFGDVLGRLEARPGVVSAAVASRLPLAGQLGGGQAIDIEGRSFEDPDLRPRVGIEVASERYFDTLGVPLLRGRPFSTLDHDEASPVGIINASLARHQWGEEDPIGRRVSIDGGGTWIEIVGVVGDVRHSGLETDPTDVLYLPFLQRGFVGLILVRTSGDTGAMAAQIRDVVQGVDAEQPVENFRTLEEVRSGSIATPRLTATLLGLFAGLALVVTVTGITGVVATSVSQRTQEFGIRMALGAHRAEVLAMVLRQGLGLVAGGLVLGLAGALMLSRVLSTLLFETAPTDPLTFLAVASVLVLAGLAACAVPARRATGVDPILALKRQ